MERPSQYQARQSADAAIRAHAVQQPNALAYIEPGGSLTWAVYDGLINLLAADFRRRGLRHGDRVGVWMGDGAGVHVALAACHRAGLVAAGIGARSGEAEVRHILQKSSARALVSPAEHRGRETSEVFARIAPDVDRLSMHIVLEQLGQPLTEDLTRAGTPAKVAEAAALFDVRNPAPGELVLINSTSGTTGLPKCVGHDELRWHKFHDYATEAAELVSGETCMSVVPAPFGFGLWSSHFTPTFLGSPCVVMPHFDVAETLRMLEKHEVKVLMAVSTQFIMLLGDPEFQNTDLSHLRIMFTGGEAIPPDKAREFEHQTGCSILNFYGSNETGALSYTKLSDSQDRRLTTAGRIIPEVDVRMFDSTRNEIPVTGTVGQPASRGEICSLGYLDDPAANDELYISNGWMLMGDLVEVDDEEYLRIVGRTSDFIIRGGKNISAPAVEAEVSTHPDVLRCAAVAVPDEVLGERVCICVVPKDGRRLEFAELLEHVRRRGVSVEWLPERMLLLDDLPTAGGGKVAKSVLRQQVSELPESSFVFPPLRSPKR